MTDPIDDSKTPNINADHNSIAVGNISAGGDISGNIHIGNVYQTPEDDLPLSSDEIENGLTRFAQYLPERAPVLQDSFLSIAKKLRATLGADQNSLSPALKSQREDGANRMKLMCMEVTDISFRAICLGQNPPPYDSRPPFLGLFAFRPEDSEFFFGRDSLVHKLVARIKAHPFLAVLGASGSGKSSLVMAGLVPALEAQMSYLTPSSAPLSQLLAAKESASAKTVFVIDQFEELFTHPHDAAERADFIHALLELTKTNRVVITMRADFWGEVAIYVDLKQAMQEHQELIAPMNVDELHSAMEKQAAVVGLRFDPTLSESILAEVKGEPGAMPLLQHALWELWNRRHGLWIKAEEYQAFGGVRQAIASTAEEVYASCSDFERARVRDIFLRLTRLDESGEGRDTRRRVLIEELIPVNSDSSVTIKLLNKLADSRLIVKTETDVEVAHEALIRHWSRLTEWLNEDRDNLRLREGVSESSREWEDSKRDDSLLNHRGGRLELALAMSKLPRYQLNPTEQAYLNACVSLRNKEQRERERRLRYTVIASVGVAVIFLVLGSFGLIKSNESNINAQKAENNAATAQANADIAAVEKAKAEEQAKIAKARELAAKAQLLSNSDPRSTINLLLAIESMRFYRTREADTIIQKGIETFPSLFLSSTTETYYAGFSNDSKLFVYQDEKFIVHIWDLSKQKEISKIHLDYAAYIISISPDNALLLIDHGYGNGKSFYNINDGQNIFQDITSSFFDGDIYFSPDGNFIIKNNSDGYLHFLNSQTGEQVFQIICDPLCPYLSYTPNKENIIASDGSAIKIWDGKTGNLLSSLSGFHGLNDYVLNLEEGVIYVSEQNGELSSWSVSDGSQISHTTIPETDYLSLDAFPTHEHEIYITALGVEDKIWLWAGGDAPPYEFNIPKEFSPGSRIFIRGYAETYLSEPYFLILGENGLTIGNIVVDGTFVRLDTSATIYSIYSISGDGTKLASREQFRPNFLNIKNTITGTVEKIFPDHYGSSMYSSFSADGNWLLEYDDSSPFQLWSLTPSYNQEDENYDNLMNQEPRLGNLNQEGIAKLQQSITELQNVNIYSASVSDNGLWAVIVIFNSDTGYINYSMQVWDINNHQLLSNLDGDYRGASFIGPDDKYIITSEPYGNTHLFIWKTDELIDEACLHVTRNFTRAEWDQYIGDALPYQAACPNLPIEAESTPMP